MQVEQVNVEKTGDGPLTLTALPVHSFSFTDSLFLIMSCFFVGETALLISPVQPNPKTNVILKSFSEAFSGSL